MTYQFLEKAIQHIKSEGFEVMNWKYGRRRIFKVLDNRNGDESLGMYSDELIAWYRGYVTCSRRNH